MSAGLRCLHQRLQNKNLRQRATIPVGTPLFTLPVHDQGVLEGNRLLERDVELLYRHSNSTDVQETQTEAEGSNKVEDGIATGEDLESHRRLDRWTKENIGKNNEDRKGTKETTDGHQRLDRVEKTNEGKGRSQEES